MTHSSWKDDGDQPHDQWADGDGRGCGFESRAQEGLARKKRRSQEEVADLLLVDALLASMSE